MDARVIWNDGLSFTGTADSGFNIGLDGKAEAGGAEDGFRPIELMAISLGGCTAMDVISILQKKRQEITAFEVKVHAPRTEDHPKVITSAVIEYLVTGRGVSAQAVERAIELSATRYCPAQAMLGQIFPIELKYSIYEAQADGSSSLVTQSTYQLPETV